jgi:hypothetical protein
MFFGRRQFASRQADRLHGWDRPAPRECLPLSSLALAEFQWSLKAHGGGSVSELGTDSHGQGVSSGDGTVRGGFFPEST